MNDEKLIRVANLNRLMSARGLTFDDMSTRVGGRYTYWRDQCAGQKSFGEKVARKIEEKLELPRGWLDTPGTDVPQAERVPAPPPVPPVDFSDRHEVSPSDFALLEGIRTAMYSPELAKRVNEILAEVEGLKAIAAQMQGRPVAEKAKPGKGQVRGISLLGDLDEQPDTTGAGKSRGGRR